MMRADLIEESIIASCFAISADYADALTPRQGATADAVTGSRQPPLPVPIEVLCVRDELCKDLAEIASLIADEQDLHPALNRADAVNLARFIERHARWLSDHETGADNARTLNHHARALERLIRGNRTRKFEVGPCPEVLLDDEEQARCTGTLYATLQAEDQVLPSEVICSTAPLHRWTSHEWIALGRRIHGAQTTRETA